MLMENQIEIYQGQNGIVLDVHISSETVWLSQFQLSLLFDRDQSVISRHLANVFKEGELLQESNMQKMHIANSDKPVVLYNLDVIISVGYRVKSLRGTQFRQWATKRLKEFLIEGVAINEKRLAEKNKEIQILHDGIRILSRVIEDRSFHQEDLSWMQHFHLGLKLLDDYDHESLDIKGNHTEAAKYPNHSEYLELIETMRTGFNSDLFGKEKDGSFNSSIHQIRQSFHGQEVYPTIEEKAAMLLYLIVDAAACGERGVVQTAREAANNGVSLIQLRDFTSHDSEYCETATAIMDAISGTDAKFIVGERPHLVQRLGAHGVHIGEKYRDIRTAREEIGRQALLGVSGFTAEQIVADVGADFSVDYLSVGPVWETMSKQDAGASIGPEQAEARAAGSPFASMLIGGITYQNIGELKNIPASGAVVLGEICRAKNVGFATRNLIAALNKK